MQKKYFSAVGICLLAAGSVFGDNFTRDSGDTSWSNTNQWNNLTAGEFDATDLPTISDQILLNANRVLTVDTNAFAHQIVMPNAKNTSSTLVLDESSAGYTLTVNNLLVGIFSQTNSHGYVNQSDGTVAAAEVKVYGAVGGSGTYTMTGGTLSGTALTVGSTDSRAVGAALFSQTGGAVNETTVNVAGAGTQTYTMAGGTLTAAALNVDTAVAGATGTSTFEHSAGTVTAATFVGADGTYNLSGTAILNATTLTAAGTVNQSGGTVNAALNVAAGGNYNLTVGTLNSTIAADITVDGTLTIDGGTMSIDQGPANVVLNGDGLLKLQSGTFEATGTEATDLLDINADLEISGGSFSLLGQTRVNGSFTVIGDAADISLARLSAAGGGSMSLVFDDTGVSTVNVSAWMNLSDLDLVVDGSAYTGDETSFVLLDAVNNTANLNSYTVTGFGDEGVDWEIVETLGTGGSADVVLNIIPEPAAAGLIIIFGGSILFAKRRFNF